MRCVTTAAMVLLLGGVGAPAAHAQCGGQWLPGYGVPGVNGTVGCMTLWDPDGPGPLPESLVIGGSFSIVKTTPAKNLAMWDGTQWTEIGGGTNAPVQQLCVYDGKLYISGTFTAAGGTPVGPLAFWNGTTWTSVESAAESVTALQVYKGELVVSGSLRVFGSGTAIAKWNGAAWSFLGPGSTVLGGTVQRLTVHDGKLIAAGTFTSVGGKAAGRIAAWDGGWTPLGTGVAAPSEIQSLCVYNGQLYAGGTFTEIGGVAARGLGRWTGTAWEPTGLPTSTGSSSFRVGAMTVFDGKLVLERIGSSSTFITWDGVTWGTLGQSGVGAVCLQPFGASLFAGTSGSSVRGRGITELRDDRWKPIELGFDSSLRSLTLFQDELVLGGAYTRIIGEEMGPATAAVSRWNGAKWSAVGTPAASGSRQVLGIDSLLHMNISSGTVHSWNGTLWNRAPDLSFNLPVLSLGRYKSDLIVTRDAQNSGDPASMPVAAWNGSSWKTLGSDLIGSPQRSVEYQGDLVVSKGVPRLSLVSDPAARAPFRFDGTAWHGWPIGVTFGGPMVVYNGKLVVGGGDSSIVLSYDGKGYGSVAVWEGDRWESLKTGQFATGQVSVLKPYKDDLIAAGSFTMLGSVHANNIARWNGTEWKPMGDGLGGGAVLDVQQFGDELVAVGQFTHAGGEMSAYFARWTDDPKPWLAVQPQSKPVNRGLLLTLHAAAASGYVDVSYQWKRDGEPVLDGPGGASVGGGIVSGAAGALASPSDGSDVVLRIEGVQASDAGEYTVEFSNACNTTSSWQAAVTVNTCPGDLNADGFVSDTDFEMFAAAYDAMLCDDPAMPVGCLSDWNGDGVVDDDDFQIFVVAYGGMVCA